MWKLAEGVGENICHIPIQHVSLPRSQLTRVNHISFSQGFYVIDSHNYTQWLKTHKQLLKIGLPAA